MRSLDLSYNDLSDINSDLLAETVNLLEEVAIHVTNLDLYQVNKILGKLSKRSRLKCLNISGDLRPIDPSIIASSFTNLEKIILRSEKTLLSSLAMKELFNKIASPESKLKELDLQCRDLSRIDPCILAKAVNNLRVANIMDTLLSDQQIQSIFDEVSEGATKLRYLDIRGSDLRILDKQIYIRAKQKIDFIFHSLDDGLENFIVAERVFGNIRR